MDEATLVAGVTRAIHEFEIYTRHGLLDGEIRISNLHRIYQRIQPVLHPLAASDREIDLDALGYALARLPHNICTVDKVRLKREVPGDFEQWMGVVAVPTDVQGRPTYDIGGGEILMLIQEDVGDVLEILSLLCSLTIECKKIRERLVASGLHKLLDKYAPEQKGSSGFGFPIKANLPAARKNQLFALLAFELGSTVEALMRLDQEWNGLLIQKMHEIANWDHDILVQFHSTITRWSYASRIHEWCQDVARALDELGLQDRPLHVICHTPSDPYSVVDVLTSEDCVREVQRALRLTRSETLKRLHKDMEMWEGELDEPNYSYYLSRQLSSEGRFKRREDKEIRGIYEVEDRHKIGLRCRIIDVDQLDLSKVDSRLEVSTGTVQREKPVILFYGGVFGSQGGKILQAFTQALPKRIRSFNVVFLGGALEGGRGTILIPNYVIKDGTMDVIDFLVPNSFSPKWLEGLTKLPVHSGGPVVTVLGIVLQSRQQLVHYNKLWKAIGVETIAAPHANSLNHAFLDGNLASDMEFRLAYVATDNPVREKETLAHTYRYTGVAPHYAITIALLNSILGR